MIQRLDRRPIEQELNLAKQELLPHFESLAQLSFEQLSNPESGEIIHGMLNQLSNPMIGIPLLRHNLAQAQFPYMAQYEMVFQKAQMFYFQSILHDITRIKSNDIIIEISKEEIRQCIEQVNWKINVERSSIMNESQQVGENIELMKFFEGIRNYQNWNEKIKKQCLQRLKQKSRSIQLELTLKRGFIVSKIDQILKKLRLNNLSQIFTIQKQQRAHEKLSYVFKKLYINKLQKPFSSIKQRSKSVSEKSHKLITLIEKYSKKNLIHNLRVTAKTFKQKSDDINRLIASINVIKRRKSLLMFALSFKQMNFKSILKASSLTEGTQKLHSICKKISVKKMMRIFNIPAKVLDKVFTQLYLTRYQSVFTLLKENNIEIQLQRPNVSNKVKATFLASLDKYQKEPITLKKTFNKWYVNTHQQKFSKKVYNIWLEGNVSKFTFFMRLKNLCDISHKQIVGKQMKHFLRTLFDKFQKYEEHQVKHKLIQWLDNTRRLRKIQNMFTFLTDITNETHQTFKSYSLEKIINFCKKRTVVKKYLIQYMKSFIEKRIIAIESWSKVNNIKKSWGKQKLRSILLRVTEDTKKNLKDTLEIMKADWQLGKQKKLKVCRKTINTDTLFLSSFFHVWRFNENKDKLEQKIATNIISDNKHKSLSIIASMNSKSTSSKLKQVLHKFRQFKSQKLKRIDGIQNKLLRIISNNEEQLLKETLNKFVDNLNKGINKKEQLVVKLVHANFVKEKLTFSMIRNKAQHMTDLLRIQRCTKFHELLESTIKENMLIFNKKLFVSKILKKIATNRANNIQLALQQWKTMPLRMRWNLRQKVIKMSESIKNLKSQRLSFCNNIFKKSLIQGKASKKKGVYIMACKFERTIKKYFEKYHVNAMKMKENHKIKTVVRAFETLRSQANVNISIVFKAEPEWPKKQKYIHKLGLHLNKRLKSYIHSWQKNTESLKTYEAILNEKKKRVLMATQKLLIQQQISNTRKTIATFDKNRRIQNLQINFLKKLCEGKIGKMMSVFTIWKGMPMAKNKGLVVNASQFGANLVEMMKRNLKQTLKSFIDCKRKGQQRKYQGINRLVAIKCGDIGGYFHKWLYNKRLIILNQKNKAVEKIFTLIHEHNKQSHRLWYVGDQMKNKIKALEIIEYYWSQNKRQCLKKWQKSTNNLKLRDISRRHLLLNLINIKKRHQNKQITNNVISKFKGRRKQNLREKKQNKIKALVKTLENQDSIRRTMLNQTIDKLKYNHYRGNFQKNQAFHKFLREKIGNVHQCLSIWNNLAMKAKALHKDRIVTRNFDSINQTVRSHFKLVFTRGRQIMIMKSTLDKIFVAKEIQFKAYFNLWRQRIKQLKILGQMDKKAKASILERINKIVGTTSTAKVAETIKKFHMNFKIQKVQKKFIERLLQTKSGKVIQLFNTWKTIPYSQKFGKFKKYQKLYFDLQNFYKGRLKEVHSKFTDSQDDGNLMKKQSILKLFEMTSLGIRRFYNRWTRFTKQKHTLMQVNKTIHTFQSVQGALANQYMIIFQDQRAYRIKIAAINKLIEACKGTTQNYFTIWRQNARQLKMMMSMDKEKKKMALSMFNKVMGNSSTGQVINIIAMFQKNASMVRISRNFFNRLMHTKTGKVLKFFEKLKTVPDAKLNQRKKRGIIFESRLHNFTQKRIRFALTPFKESTYDADIKKKYCLDRLMRACMGQNKKKFLVWRNVVRQGKILKHTSLCEDIFSNIENVFRDNFLIINKDTKAQIQKKKNLCRKLVNNASFVQAHAYLLWKEAYHVDDIKIKEKQSSTQNHLRNLFEVHKEHENKQLVQNITAFRKVLETIKLKRSLKQKDIKNQKGIAFFNTIKTRQINNKNSLIIALRSNQAEFQLIQKSKKLDSVFEVIHSVAKSNTDKLFKKKHQNSFLEVIFTQLYNNQWNNMRKILSIWQGKSVHLSHKDDKKQIQKQHALINLDRLKKQDQNKKIAQTVHKFREMFNAMKNKKRYCLRLLTRKTDNFKKAYQLWKVLPYQQAKKRKSIATLFESKLNQLMLDRLKQIQATLKRNSKQGLNKKHNAVRNIVRCKLTDLNTCFFKWRKNNNERKVKQKIVSLDKVFSIVNTVFKQNLPIFEQSKISDQRKIQATNRIFTNNVKKLKGYFNQWRQINRKIKLNLLERYMKNFNPEEFNKKLLRIAFMQIEKKNQLQSMKGFINSLWKWKMSNMQATYYSKFIKVFKQSEEMVRFSNLLNKKHYENVHHAFRNILEEGHGRTNRKRQIVQKYLTKRLRGYFMTFKNSTASTQINIWKSKYTNSIKAKILYDILNTLILRLKFSSVEKLKGNQYYASRIDLFEKKIGRFKELQTKDAFNKILLNAPTKLFSLLSKLEQSSLKRTLKQNFNLIYSLKKLSKLEDIIGRTLERSQLYTGFNRIRQKKEKVIRARLAIVLLSTLLSQHKNYDNRKVVQMFAKNKTKHIGAEKLYSWIFNQQKEKAGLFFIKGSAIINMNKLLLRFKRGLAIQKVLEKQDKQLLKEYLNRMRKKENKWMELAIQKFATRASIRSSPAISLWRLKAYVMNT